MGGDRDGGIEVLCVECPQVLREAWATLMNAGHEPSPADWAHYHDVLCVEVLLSPHANRPGALMVGDPTMCRLNSMGGTAAAAFWYG